MLRIVSSASSRPPWAFSSGSSAGARGSRMSVTGAFDRPELDRHPCVNEPYALGRDHLEQPLGLGIGDDEIDLHRNVACQLEEMLLVQDTMTAESRDCTKRTAALDAARLGSLQQPFIEQHMVMPAVLMHVKAQQRARHDIPQAKSRRASRIPAIVRMIEPATCAPIAMAPQRSSRRSSSVVISAENVENVVR